MGLFNEIEQESKPPKKPCGLTIYMTGMDSNDLADLQKALDDESFMSSTIHRVLKRRGFTGSEIMVRRHRRRECGCR